MLITMITQTDIIKAYHKALADAYFYANKYHYISAIRYEDKANLYARLLNDFGIPTPYTYELCNFGIPTPGMIACHMDIINNENHNITNDWVIH